jgi:hypothetical protein
MVPAKNTMVCQNAGHSWWLSGNVVNRLEKLPVPAKSRRAVPSHRQRLSASADTSG